MVVLSHLQQMTLLMIKKGLFFYCEQDTFQGRTKFLDNLISLNKLVMISFETIFSIADFYGWFTIIASIIGAIFMYRHNKRLFKKPLVKPLVKPSVPRSTPIVNLSRS
jgi:hypothetical protein